MKGAAAGVAGADPDRQARDVRLRPGGPAERVRGKLTARADELSECATVHAVGVERWRLDQRTFQYLNIHPGKIALAAA